jgi:hypothetical protein
LRCYRACTSTNCREQANSTAALSARAIQENTLAENQSDKRNSTLELSVRIGHNKTNCAVANKLARICLAVGVSEIKHGAVAH